MSGWIIVRGNGRDGPIYWRFIGRKSNVTVYQLVKVTPLQFNVQKQQVLPEKVMYVVERSKTIYACSGIILLGLNHFSSNLSPPNSKWKLIWICVLIRGLERNSSAKSIFQQTPRATAQLLNSPWQNIRAPIPSAKLYHLAGKASKSCYKLREDRVAHHLWMPHWSPGDVIRITPALFNAKKPNHDKTGFICHRL